MLPLLEQGGGRGEVKPTRVSEKPKKFYICSFNQNCLMKKNSLFLALSLSLLFVQANSSVAQTETKVKQSQKTAPLLIIDGKVDHQTKLNEINPEKIESMNVLKGESAEKKYGKGVQSAIEIKMKPSKSTR